jgi:hypothetical protein
MQLLTLSDARASPRVLQTLFLRQVADARRYGHSTWMLAVWHHDVWYGWGLGAEAYGLRSLLESYAPVRVVSTPRGLRVTTNRLGTPLDRAKAPSAPLAPESQPVLPATRSLRANTM